VIVGAHCSGGIRRSLDRAAEIGADAVQLFAQSPRAWRFPEHDPADLARFRERRKELKLKAALVHTLYLANLASPDDTIYEKSTSVLRSTMEAACAIDADGVVFHVGSHLGAGFEHGLERVVPALESVLELCSERTWLLVENSAGAGGTIGRSVDELATIVDRLGRHPRLGICLDTCHLWVSGYDVTDAGEVDRLVDEVDAKIGLDRLRVLHINDARDGLGSNRDRHANIGEGVLGDRLRAFLGHPALRKLPAVLEVPGADDHGPDAAEVAKLKALYKKAARSRTGRQRKKAKQ
jgi:deoxyribonuclease IV